MNGYRIAFRSDVMAIGAEELHRGEPPRCICFLGGGSGLFDRMAFEIWTTVSTMWVTFTCCLASLATLSLLGRYFLKRSLLRRRDLIEFPLGTVFSASFALSGNLLFMLILEALGAGDSDGRKSCWKANAWILSLVLTIVLPTYHVKVSASGRGVSQRTAWMVATIAELAFLWSFWRLGRRKDTGETRGEADGYLDPIMERLGALGATIMAILSGYGSVMMPFGYLNAFVRPVSEGDVENLEWRIDQAKRVLGPKKKELDCIMEEKKRNLHLSHKQGLFVRILSSVGQKSRQQEKIDRLRMEIDALEDVCRHLGNELKDANVMKKRHLRSGTILGGCVNLFGYITSGYCLWRLFSSALNLLMGTSGYRSDPVGRAAAFLLTTVNVPVDHSTLSQYLTLGFIAFVSANSIRGFVKDVLKFVSMASNGASAGVLALVFAEFMGLYCLSFILLVQQRLPSHLREPISKAFGGRIEFTFFARWFDIIFITSALFTMLMIFTHRKVTSQESYLEEGTATKASPD